MLNLLHEKKGERLLGSTALVVLDVEHEKHDEQNQEGRNHGPELTASNRVCKTSAPGRVPAEGISVGSGH